MKKLLVFIFFSLSLQSFSQTVQQRLGINGKIYNDSIYPSIIAQTPLSYVPATGLFSLGNIPVTNLNYGTGASATTYWRGDGTWAAPAGGGGGADSAIWKNDGTYLGNRLLTMGGYSQQFAGGRLLLDSLRVGSTFRVNSNTQGLRIGFNDSTISNSTGANINITNFGTSATPGLQSYDNITGNGNMKMIASSANKTKASGSTTISGNNNTLINSTNGATLSGIENTVIGSYFFGATTGSGNVGLGARSFLGITSGSNNGYFITQNDGSVSVPSSVSNSWIFGDMAGNASVAGGDVIFNPYLYSTTRLYLGSKAGTGQPSEIYASPNISNASTGGVFNIKASTGTAGDYGPINLMFGNNVLQKTESSGITIGKATTLTKTSASALFDVQSTTQGSFPFPRMTNTQRDALSGVVSLSITAGGTGYGNIAVSPLTFSGGGGSGAAGYVVAQSGGINVTAIITNAGTGYTFAPTVTVGGVGTGSTVTATVGVPEALHIYSLTDHADEYYNGTTWKIITTN